MPAALDAARRLASSTRKAAGSRGGRRAAPAVTARFRLRVTSGDVIAVGPGKISLLEAIAETRSISAAARSIGMSYRRAWLLVDEINRALGEPAVASATGGEHGGGSTLTTSGQALVTLYRRIEARAAAATAADMKRLLAMLA